MKNTIPPLVYKIVVLIILVLVLYLVWKMPPARPFEYRAYYIPSS